MSKFNFDDTETSGIWLSTNVAIKDLCLELKEDTSCDDIDIVELLRSIAKSIELFRFIAKRISNSWSGRIWYRTCM